MLKSIRDNKKNTVLTAVFGILEVVMEVTVPILVALLINIIENADKKGIQPSDIHQILLIGGILLVTTSLALLFGFLSSRAASTASTGFARNLRLDIYKKIQGFSFVNIEKFSTSGLVTRLTTDVSNVQQAYHFSIRLLVRTPVMLILAIVMALIVQPMMALVFVATIPVLAIGLVIMYKKAFPKFQKGYDTYDELNEVVQENIRGMRVVKSFTREEFENAKALKTSAIIKENFGKANKYMAFNTPLLQLCLYVGVLLISWFGAKLIVSGDMKTGEIMSLLTYSSQILGALNLMSLAVIMVVIAWPSGRRIKAVFNEESTIVNPKNPVCSMDNGSIEFDNVSFSYLDDSQKMVLTDINLSVNSGEIIGILGGTASSKSSLVSLIPRLYDVSLGQVRVAGHDVKDYDIKTLRDGVAMVLQKNVLFGGTIKENLLWGNAGATDDEIVSACKLACAHDFVSSFKKGYDTIIDQGGTNVSGGQKQRLCIARALLKNPKILILDDSTSAVDTKTEAMIFKAMQEKIPGVTKLIISQRISSVENADKIIVLDAGKIDGVGKHAELLASNIIYQEVYESQVKGKKEND